MILTLFSHDKDPLALRQIPKPGDHPIDTKIFQNETGYL